MRLTLKLLFCLCLTATSTLSQERIRQVMVGPNKDLVRIVVVFIEPSRDTYNMQSMIIDLDAGKNGKEEVPLFQVDLTSTVRSLSTGAKRQKILLLRWKKTGEIELKCDGKWVKRDATSALDRIIEATRAVIQGTPLDTKSPIEMTLSPEVEQKVSAVLNALTTDDLPCLKSSQ